MKYSVIIPCAGKGTRANLGFNKLFAYIEKKTVIERSCELFLEDERCTQIVIPYNKEDEKKIKSLVKGDKVYFVEGSDERYKSVYSGLQIVSEQKVLIHDGARPFLTKEKLDELLEVAASCNACMLGINVVDTIKYVEDGIVKETLDRSHLFQAQTPQAFTTDILMSAYEKAMRVNRIFTDDVAIIEMFTKEKIRLVEGDPRNLKITFKEDIITRK